MEDRRGCKVEALNFNLSGWFRGQSEVKHRRWRNRCTTCRLVRRCRTSRWDFCSFFRRGGGIFETTWHTNNNKCEFCKWWKDKQRQRRAKTGQCKPSPPQQNLDKAVETLRAMSARQRQVSPVRSLISAVQISTQERLCVRARLKSQVTAAGGGSTNTTFSNVTFAEPHHVKSSLLFNVSCSAPARLRDICWIMWAPVYWFSNWPRPPPPSLPPPPKVFHGKKNAFNTNIRGAEAVRRGSFGLWLLSRQDRCWLESWEKRCSSDVTKDRRRKRGSGHSLMFDQSHPCRHACSYVHVPVCGTSLSPARKPTHAARGHTCFGWTVNIFTAKPKVIINESSGLIEQQLGRVLRYVIFLQGAGWVISQEQATASAVPHPTIPRSAAPPGTQEHESQVHGNLPIEHFHAALFSLRDLQDAKLQTRTHSTSSNYRAAVWAVLGIG